MISADDLIEFIETNDTHTVLETLKSMSEEERLALGAEALGATSRLGYRASQTLASLTKGHTRKERADLFSEQEGPLWKTFSLWESAKVAVLYCCEFADIQNADVAGLPSGKYCLQILRDRKPKWVRQWCSHALRNWPWQTWQTVHELDQRRGKKQKRGAAHYTAMALGMPSTDSMATWITESPSLREEVYNLLSSPEAIRAMAAPDAVTREIKFRSFRRSISRPMAWEDRPSASLLTAAATANFYYAKSLPDRWIECLSRLSATGVLDRERLVDQSFQNLTSTAEIKDKRKSHLPEEPIGKFLCSLNHGLCPDKKPYLSRYAALSGATNTDIAKYALNILIDASLKDLPFEETILGIEMAFRNQDKDPATLALRLLDKLARHLGVEAESIGLATIEAFNHKSQVIHKEAIALLVKTNACKYEAVHLKLQNSFDLLQGVNRSAATKLLPANQPKSAAPTEKQNIPVARLESNDSGPLSIPADMNSNWTQLAGLNELVAKVSTGSPFEVLEAVLAPVDLVSMNTPRLNSASQVQRIESLDDLIFLASAAVTNGLTSEKKEFLLDGIARLGQERPPDFDDKVKSLRSLLATNPGTYINEGMPIALTFQIWLEGKEFNSYQLFCSPKMFAARCLGLAARLWAGEALPLLAAPTHKEGWIDPNVLVGRVKEYQNRGRLLDCTPEKWPWSRSYAPASGQPPPDLDDLTHYDTYTRPKALAEWLADSDNNKFGADAPEFVQALLRLAPDGRHLALAEAKSIKGDFGATLRYALGDGEITSIKRPEFAIAACRSRFPRGECTGVETESVALLPDGMHPAKYSFNKRAVAISAELRHRTMCLLLPDFLSVYSEVKSAFPIEQQFGNSIRDLETFVVYEEELKYLLYPSVFMHSNQRSFTWAADYSRIWMQNKEPLIARLSKEILLNINSVGASWQNDYTIFFDPDFPLYENGSWWLALALAAKHDPLRQLGLDILIAGVEESRVDARTLSQSMTLLNTMRHKKWTDAIRELARVSALHAIFSWQLLLNYLLLNRIDPHLGFLEVMLELEETYGFGLTKEMVEVLGSFRGTGKAAKIAKSLSAKGENWRSLDTLNAAVGQSFAARMARVERWQQSQYAHDTMV